MFDKEEYRARRNAGLRGQTDETPAPKVIAVPKDIFMVKIKGEETHVPRREKRLVYRKYMTALRKGRISFEDLMARQKDQEDTQEVKIEEGAIQ